MWTKGGELIVSIGPGRSRDLEERSQARTQHFICTDAYLLRIAHAASS
jgi:hypothetical protein